MLRTDCVFERDPQSLRQSVDICGVAWIKFDEQIDVTATTGRVGAGTEEHDSAPDDAEFLT